MEAFPETPGLYLHVPFCGTLCPFCPYNKVQFEADLSAAYFRRLARELAAYADLSPGPFPSLYVGGGTPTLCLDGLIPLVRDLDVKGERAIEVLPTHMTPQGAQRLLDVGFDFVSLGVQSFHAPTLRRLRRPTSPRQNRAAVEVAVDRFTCVDVDLIFDAAYDEPSVLLDDLRTCFRQGVHQVSTYPLMRFGYTPFGRQRHERRKEHALLRRARELAAEHGYERRSVWTFNRADSPSYTSITRPYYLGLGAGAATYAGVVFSVNHFGLEPYMRSVDQGGLPMARLARLPVAAASAYRTFWQAYAGRLPLRSPDRLLSHPMAKTLATGARAAGWVAEADGALQLTPSGYDRYHDLERWVTYHLIEPLWADLMREHAAPSGPSRRPFRHDPGCLRPTD
jgi:coproporphyrinogen III oxidase-like Fe-S oxidoreductase